MNDTNSDQPIHDHAGAFQLPSYLSHHFSLGFDDDDVASLLKSIDSSQKSNSDSASALPAELLLHILEYVPVDYVLDWRLVCRGFRNAIDGRILFYHLRRTQLIGYLGSKHARPLENLDGEDYSRIHLIYANFHHLENSRDVGTGIPLSEPSWSNPYAVFQPSDDWYRSFHEIGGAMAMNGDTIQDADPRWMNTLDRLELHQPEEGFGTLRWCIKLDHAVLDLDFPMELGRNSFDIQIDLQQRFVIVAWREMLLSFLKTEAALRRMLKDKQNSICTFSLAEDCLRAIRRQRLIAGLDPDNKVDRHIKWSLRLLHPLFGLSRHDHTITLDSVENDATDLLLLLRREASMTSRQINYLYELASDYETMDAEIRSLDLAFREFKSNLAMPGFQLSVSLPGLHPRRLGKNPISWPDDQLVKVEAQIRRWKSQKQVIEQMKSLLNASNMALTLPEDSFENIGMDF